MAQARGAPGLSRLRPPALALAIPALGVAALAGLVAATHRGTSTPPGPERIAVITPTPEPTPTAYPTLLSDAADTFTLLAPRSFGPINPTPLPSFAPPGTSIDLTIANPPAGLPAALPVWQLTARPLDPSSVAVRFGIKYGTPAAVENGAYIFSAGLSVDPARDDVSWQVGSGVAAPRLGGKPLDRTSAYFLGGGWLRSSGLEPAARTIAIIEQTSNGEGASFAEWTITWRRSAPGYSQYPIDSVVARVSGDGTLKALRYSSPTVSKGALYPLRPWQDAVRDAEQGHWYQQCCQPLPELNTPGSVRVTISSVSLQYVVVETPRGMLAVPMYALAETGGTQPGLVPAIAP